MLLYLLPSECVDKIHVKHHIAYKDHGCTGFVLVFACMVRKNLKTQAVVCKNPKTLKLNPIADDTITQDGMGSL